MKTSVKKVAVPKATTTTKQLNSNKKPSQCQEILLYMRSHGSISQVEAVSVFGCYRLSARIFDLKKQGHNIICDREANVGAGYHARYRLEE